MNYKTEDPSNLALHTEALSPPRISAFIATAIVVASMIGTGVFTSLGFQVEAFRSAPVLLALWLVGGVVALAGALCYAELGAAMPRSGGEYHFLSKIYHPAAGFLAGWVSLTVGFAAPVALAAMALAAYCSPILRLSRPSFLTAGVVIVVALVHALGIKPGSRFQTVFTAGNVLLIGGFSVCGLLIARPQPLRLMPTSGDFSLMASAAFAVSLVYVTYSYSGWNGSAYVAGEMRNSGRDLPLSLVVGTLVVTGLYIMLNFIFLWASPMDELSGKIEVGYIAARHIFGPVGASIMGGLISLGLVSTISAMTWAGSRVGQVMGEDYRALRLLAAKNASGAPWAALLLQLALVMFMLVTSTFQKVLTCLGFTLAFSTTLTVLGVMVLRARRPDLPRPYRTWGYPVTPLVFLAVNGWMLVYLMIHSTGPSLAGLGTVIAGLLVYFAVSRKGWI